MPSPITPSGAINGNETGNVLKTGGPIMRLPNKRMTISGLILLLLAFSACTHLQPSGCDDNIAQIENRLMEANHQIEKIQKLLSESLITVDRQARLISKLETALEKEKENNTAALFSNTTLAAPSHASSSAKQTVSAKDPRQLYNEALKAYKHNNYLEALSLFALFIKHHPKHSLADNALYWSGECHYTQSEYETSVVFFKKVVSQYPDGNKVPDALLKIGFSYLELGDFKNGRTYLTRTVSVYPHSAAGITAQKRLAAHPMISSSY
jgi:tol-pal system protein YbgF